MNFPHRYQTLCILFIFLLPFSIFGQNRQLLPDNIQLHFLKDSFEVEANSFAFNSCSVLFTATGEVHAELSVSAPEDVSILTPQKNTLVTLSNDQQQMIPIRFLPAGNLAQWQAITLLLRIRETGQEFSGTFYFRQKANMKWKAALVQPEILRSQTDGDAEVSFWVENTGNVADEYRVTVDAAMPLLQSPEKVMKLAPGERKMNSFRVSLRNLKTGRDNNEKINIRIRPKDGDEKLYIQQVTMVGSRYTENNPAWRQLPLYLEMSALRSPQTNPIYSAALRGQMDLSGSGKLLFDGRWYNFTNPQRNARMGSVQFQNDAFSLRAGSIIDFHHFLINGTGLELKKKTKGGDVDIAVIRGNIYNTTQYKTNWREKISSKVSLQSDNFSNQDFDRKVYSTLTVNNLEWQLSKKTKLALTLGGSYEQVRTFKDPKDFLGGALGYRLETGIKQLQVRSRVEQYSQSFAGFNKGFTFQDHELKQMIGRSYVSAFYQANKKIYTDIQDSLFTNLFNINNTEYGVRTGLNTKGFSLLLSGGRSMQQQDSVNSPLVEGWRTTASMLWNFAPQATLSLSTNMSVMGIRHLATIAPIRAFNNYGSVQYKKLGFYFQYNTGPYYYFETRQYLQNQQDYRRVQLAPYFEQPFTRINSSLRLQLLYNEELPNNFSSFAINSQLSFSPPSFKGDVSINSSYNLKQVNASFVMVTVRKQLQLPVAKNRKSRSFSAILFRDVNGNNVFDEGTDEPLPHAMLLIHKQTMQTGSDGIMHFKNVGEGPFHVDLSRVRVDGWMPSQGYQQTIIPLPKNKMLYIPFKPARIIKGDISLVSDAYSEKNFTVGNIRVTATGDDGSRYSTITDESGSFYFNLPAGHYIVNLNPEAFDKEFVAEETTQTADLLYNQQIDLHFQVRQQKRKINIRKID